MAVGAYATLAGVKARAGITDTTDDALLQTLCDQQNDWIERYIGRAVAPLTATTLTLDVTVPTRRLLVPFGIRTLTQLEIATQTGAAYSVVPSSDYVLRPPADLRVAGAPAFWIVLKDATGWQFWPGTDTVRLTGTFGWAQIPEDLVEIAEVAVIRAYQARRAGQVDVTGSDLTGQPIVSRGLSARDMATLRSYRIYGIG
jgi:hypothetical protein